ncbi:MAG TPA: hypothetical protein VKU82_07655 [Planctomycetaceae bacterium]|nr:hypothetical protein [Planctomycetaceae bacterium]
MAFRSGGIDRFPAHQEGSLLVRNFTFVNRSPAGRLTLAAIVAALAILGDRANAAQHIEAVRGRHYKLTPSHGPWMIMVASLFDEPGHVEEQIANELVFQLRKKGVPAYTYRLDKQTEDVDAVDRVGRPLRRTTTAQHGMIAVLAGNYPSSDDKSAQQTKQFIEKFKPKIKIESKGKDVEVPLALSKAFITPNPLIPADQLAKKTRDPLIARLNPRDEYSLLKNRGKYTLVVASFNGQSSNNAKATAKFDRMLANKSKISLDNAGRESWELVTTMRKQGIDAYVYHERYRSIVTVGEFNSPNDPRIAKLIESFRAKEKLNPQTKQTALVAESIQIPGKRKGIDPPLKAWVMDPIPQLMDVPR